MIILHIDLDNTMIYSYKHDIGADKRCVEIYQGRGISYVTGKTYKLLKTAREKMIIIPTTTRTVEQYNRIDLGIGTFEYALVCNGGILLENGVRNELWYKESLSMISESKEEMEYGRRLLEKEKRRVFELRYIENLFLFTKCDEPDCVVKSLKSRLDEKKVKVFHNGTKVYIVPRTLNKGVAVQRMRKLLGKGLVIAAGDSEFDVPMLQEADYALAPEAFCDTYGVEKEIEEAPPMEIFSEFLLKKALKKADEL